MGLAALPNELWELVCKHIEDVDNLCNFRLSCHTFAAIGLHFLVPKVTLLRIPKSLERLTAIANHPVLRHHVREISYCADSVQQYRDVEHFASYLPYSDLRYQMSERPQSPAATDLERAGRSMQVQRLQALLKRLYQENQRLANQFSIYDQGDQSSILQDCFAKLPRLRSLRIVSDLCCNTSSYPNPYKWPYSEFFVSGINLCNETFPVLPAKFNVSDVLGPIAKTGIPLESLYLVNIDVLSILSGILGKNLELGNVPFSSLQKLVLPVIGIFDGKGDIEDAESVNSVLRCFPKIRSLDLSILPAGSARENFADFSIVYKGLALNNLTSLILVSLVCTAETLLQFFKATSATLVKLLIGDIDFKGSRVSDWIEFLDRTSSILHLDSARFRGSLTADDSGPRDSEFLAKLIASTLPVAGRSKTTFDLERVICPMIEHDTKLNLEHVIGVLMCSKLLQEPVDRRGNRIPRTNPDPNAQAALHACGLTMPANFRQEVFADLFNHDWHLDHSDKMYIPRIRHVGVLAVLAADLKRRGKI